LEKIHKVDGRAVMPTGPKGQKPPADLIVGNAVRVMRIATSEEEANIN
jgi:hypothetical protein